MINPLGNSNDYLALAHIDHDPAGGAAPDPFVAAWERTMAGLSPLFVIAEEALPGDAVAWIRREGGHAHPRVVAFAREVVSDELFRDTWNLLCLDETFAPGIDGARVLTVGRDSRIDAPAVAGADWPAGYRVRTEGIEGELVLALLARMTGEVLDLEGIGRVRVLLHPTRPPIRIGNG